MRTSFLYTLPIVALAALFSLSGNFGLSVTDAFACTGEFYACPPDDDDTNNDPSPGDGSSCISCEGGSIMLEGAAATQGSVFTGFEAPENSDNITVDQFAVQVSEGQSNVDLTIGTDGTFNGTASAWQMSYGGQEMTLTNTGGGSMNAASGMSTSAGAAVGLKAGEWSE